MRNKAGTHPNVNVTIHRRARELADEASSLTSEQIVLLRSIFVNRAGGGGS